MEGIPPKVGLFRKLLMGPSSAIIAAVVGGVFSLTAAIVPQLLPANKETPVLATIAPQAAHPEPAVTSSKVSTSPSRSLPRLTYGTWTLIESKDDAGTDWRNSVLKFTSQRETEDGLELEGFFEWRNGLTLIGKEIVIAHYVEATRHVYIEGQSVDCPTVLAVGSFSACLSDDDRRLTDGTWGSSAGHRDGVPGTWEARR